MTDQEFIEVYKAIEKEAARYKKHNTPDWIELTSIGFNAIKKINSTLFDWCHAFRQAKLAIKNKYYKWKRREYYEPNSLTCNITKGEHGLDYEEKEIDNSKRILIYGKDVSRKCLICNKKYIPKHQKQKYCNSLCRQKKYDKKLKNLTI